MDKQFLFINEVNKIKSLFRQFLGVEKFDVINNEFMFLITGMVDGVPFKIESGVNTKTIGTLGKTTFDGCGNELQTAGVIVKAVQQNKVEKELMNFYMSVDEFVDEQDAFESFKKPDIELDKL